MRRLSRLAFATLATVAAVLFLVAVRDLPRPHDAEAQTVKPITVQQNSVVKVTGTTVLNFTDCTIVKVGTSQANITCSGGGGGQTITGTLPIVASTVGSVTDVSCPTCTTGGPYLPLAGGTMTGAIRIYNGTDALNSGNYSWQAVSGVADGPTAVGYLLDTTNALADMNAVYLKLKSGGVAALQFDHTAAGAARLKFDTVDGWVSAPTTITVGLDDATAYYYADITQAIVGVNAYQFIFTDGNVFYPWTTSALLGQDSHVWRVVASSIGPATTSLHTIPAGSPSSVMIANSADTVTGVKNFSSGTCKIDNNSTTNAHTLVSAATAARNWTLPDATDTAMGLATAQTVSGAKDFASGTCKIDNNSTTNAHTLVSAATAARTWTFPDSSGTAIGIDSSGHFNLTYSAATSVTAGTAVGTGSATLATGSNDMRGKVTFVIGTGPSGTVAFKVTFASSYSTEPYCFLTCANAACLDYVYANAGFSAIPHLNGGVYDYVDIAISGSHGNMGAGTAIIKYECVQ